MDREEALKIVRGLYEKSLFLKKDKEAIETLIPELNESEDERIRQALIRFFKNTHDWVNLKYDGDEIVAYLEKQKEEKYIEDVVKKITQNKETATKFLKSAGIMDDNGELAEMYRSEQRSAEWSEEDEAKKKVLFSLIDSIIKIVDKDFLERHGTNREELMGILKPFRPQPHWKPSEEQMYILNWVANILLNHDSIVEEEAAKKLQSLYNDLKKL